VERSSSSLRKLDGLVRVALLRCMLQIGTPTALSYHTVPVVNDWMWLCINPSVNQRASPYSGVYYTGTLPFVQLAAEKLPVLLVWFRLSFTMI
jgi:hypothetical protein